MDKDWILQTNDTRRLFSNATWVPLRASQRQTYGITNVKNVGFVEEFWMWNGSIPAAKQENC